MRHRTGAYPVVVGADVAERIPAMIAATHPGARVAIIADQAVASLVKFPVRDATVFTFPAGEQHKTRDTWATLTDQLIEAAHDRHTLIIGMGGGVTTDLAGFVAATFLRGVPWLAVPTTTLAMIDAAIGGKTGVDTAAGKNLVGAFHPPVAVVADLGSLATLPERSYREGLAEAVKHAAILDASYGEWMSAHADRIMQRDPDALEHLVARSAQLKAEVVSGDEQEGGRRAILNAGHTVAHGLERVTNFTIPHGEAVAIGLVVETTVAERLGRCARGTAARIADLLGRFGLPTSLPDVVDTRALALAMRHDKKNRSGAVHAAFVSDFGVVTPEGSSWTTAFDPTMLP